jgi:Thiol-disulfide isomerase and thioredoxins
MKHTLKLIITLLILDINLAFGQQINQKQVEPKSERKINSLKIDMASYFHKKDSIFQLNLGKQYPAFTATSIDGQTIVDKGLIGKVTIINFWFQYCSPCIAEMNELCNLHQKFMKNPSFQFISFTSDSPEEAKESVEKLKLSFPVYPISSLECHRLNFNQGFPTTIIVDKTGKIIFLKTGGSLEAEKIAQNIREFEQIIEKELDTN